MTRYGLAILLFAASAATTFAQQPPNVAAPAPAIKTRYTASDQCTLHLSMTFTPPATVGKPVTSANDVTWAVRRHVKTFDNGDMSIKYEQITATGLKGASLPTGLVATLLGDEYVVSSAGQASVSGGRSLGAGETAFLMTDVAGLTSTASVSLGDLAKGKTISIPSEQILPLSVIVAHDAQLDLVYTGTTAGKDEFTAMVQSKQQAATALKGRLTASSDRKQLHLELGGSTTDTTPFAAAASDLRRDSQTTLRCDRSTE